ncbi:hypothetical protein LAZ67_11000066 [Cordylochernes scorpioides]|uniref:Uncharacterized protein n=1 Tax=Cordylochernes scorpioides TaxID=51811 RepID=A0ABY6L0Z8_9ARAC|nr:hypothetical protein LAZ67_11000066 [Cordylochernes scorpioides]
MIQLQKKVRTRSQKKKTPSDATHDVPVTQSSIEDDWNTGMAECRSRLALTRPEWRSPIGSRGMTQPLCGRDFGPQLGICDSLKSIGRGTSSLQWNPSQAMIIMVERGRWSKLLVFDCYDPGLNPALSTFLIKKCSNGPRFLQKPNPTNECK